MDWCFEEWVHFCGTVVDVGLPAFMMIRQCFKLDFYPTFLGAIVRDAVSDIPLRIYPTNRIDTIPVCGCGMVPGALPSGDDLTLVGLCVYSSSHSAP